jgi:hypothetical protein
MDYVNGYNGDAKREDLVKILRSNIAEVIFTKVTGEERVMHCTLIPEMLPDWVSTLPSVPEEIQRGFEKHEPTAIAVWDLDHNGWRAFRVDSVKSISYSTKPV